MADTVSATAAVIAAPVSAYHVHASAPVHQITVSAAIPAIMPVSIGPVVTRFVPTPTRNAPSTGPLASESTDRPASSTDRAIHCDPSATPTWTMPQAIVARRAKASRYASSAFGLT